MRTVHTYVYVAIIQNPEGQWEKLGWIGSATDTLADETKHLNDHDFITQYIRGGKWEYMGGSEEDFKSALGIARLLPLASAAEMAGTPLTARKPMK